MAATQGFYVARLDSLTTTFHHHVFWAREFDHWEGYLEGVQVNPTERAGFVAELLVRIRHDMPRNRQQVELTYLLAADGRVQQVAKRDLTNLSDVLMFKPIVEEWVREIPVKERQTAITQTRAIKEDLMAAAWAPARVAKWVEAGSWDVLD